MDKLRRAAMSPIVAGARTEVRVLRACGIRWLCALMFLAVGVAAQPAQAGDIVIVLSTQDTPYAQAEVGIRNSLTDRKDSLRTVSLADVKTKGLPATVGENAEMVIAVGTAAAAHLHRSLPEKTPLTYCMVAQPAEVGLTQGRATYGVTTNVPLETQLGLIAEALPNARVVGMLYRSNSAEGQRQLKSMQEAMPQDWRLEAIAVDKHASIADAIDNLLQKNVDIIWTSADATIYDKAGVTALLLKSGKKQIPVFGFSPAFVRAGALLGIGIDPAAQGKQVADLAAQVLKNQADNKPKAVNSAADCEIAVNQTVAQNLRMELPTRLVERAVHVFKSGDK